MSLAVPILPILPKILPTVLAPPLLGAAVRLENAEFDHPNWASQTSKLAHVESVRLIEPDLTSAQLRQGGWSDVEISGGQLGGLNLTSCSLRRLVIQRARLSGAVFSEAELKDITVEDGKLDLANFRFSKLTRVQFVRCQLQDADFGAARLSDVGFTSCVLDDADFSGAVLRHVDLRSSTLARLKGVGGLKGAILSSDQMVGLLPELAATLGIEVSDT